MQYLTNVRQWHCWNICSNSIDSIYQCNINSFSDTNWKKDTTWKNDVNNLSVCSLKSLLLHFLDKHDVLANKDWEFFNSTFRKVLITINGMPHQVSVAKLQSRDVYPKLKKYFLKEVSKWNGKSFQPKNLVYELIRV